MAQWEPTRDEVRPGAPMKSQHSRPKSSDGSSASGSKSNSSRSTSGSGSGVVTQLPPRHSNDAFNPRPASSSSRDERQRDLELEHELQALGDAQLSLDGAWPAELHPSSRSASQSQDETRPFAEGLSKRRVGTASPSVRGRSALADDSPVPATRKQHHHATHHQDSESRCSCSRSNARASPDSGDGGLSHSLSRPPSRRSSDAQLRPYLAAGDDDKERSRSSRILDPLQQARFRDEGSKENSDGTGRGTSEDEHEAGCPQRMLMAAGREAATAEAADSSDVPLLGPVPLTSDSRKRHRLVAAIDPTLRTPDAKPSNAAHVSSTLSAYLASYYLQLTSSELLRALCMLFAAYMVVVVCVLLLPFGIKDPLVFPSAAHREACNAAAHDQPRNTALLLGLIASFLFCAVLLVLSSWWTPTVSMLCVVAMHLMKLCFNVSALKGREKIILSCLCVNCICCVAYGANALGFVRIYMDAHGRRFLPTRFLEWICATPLLVLLIANLSDFLFRADKNLIQILPLRLLIPNGPRYERVPWVVAADVCMLVLGALGGLVPSRAGSVCCIVGSCGFFVVTMNGLDAFLAHTQSCCQWLVDLSVTFKNTSLTSVERSNPQSRSVQLALMRAPAFASQQQQNVRILRLLRVWVLCTWSLFPLIYALAESHCISDFTEESLYFFGDIVAKVLLSAAMQSLNLGALDASMDVKSLVEQEAHNEAHRQRRILSQRAGLLELDANEKDNFLRYVFHEIRIPLNSLILGVLDLSSMPLLDAAVLDTVRMMSQAASYIPHLLDDVLSLQKITSGKYVLECHAGSLQQMVLAAMSMMASTINQKNLHIAFYVDPHLPLLTTDFHLLRQVVANFLSNALKFTRSDSRLTITVKRVPPPHTQQLRELVTGDLPKQLKPPLSLRPKTTDAAEQESSGRSSESASNASMPSERSLPSGESGVSGSALPNQQQLHHVEGGRYGDVESVDAQEVPAPIVHSFATPCTRCNRLVASTRMCVCEGSQMELPAPSDSPQPLILPMVWVRVSVRDSGCGISPENQRLLFHPFVQIDAEKTQGGKGSGLGLNICKKIIELFQGRIGIMSALNVGSEFYFVVPLQIAAEGDIEASAEWGARWAAESPAAMGWGTPAATAASASAAPAAAGAPQSDAALVTSTAESKESTATARSNSDASVPSMPTDESQFAFPPISPADYVRRSAAIASDLTAMQFQSLPIRIMSAASHSKVLWDNVKDARTRRENQAALALKTAADAASAAVAAGAHTAAVVAAAAAAAVVAMGAPVRNAHAAAAAAAAAALQAAAVPVEPTPPPTPMPAARNLRVPPVSVPSTNNAAAAAASAAASAAAAPATGVSPNPAPTGSSSPSATSQASAPSQTSAAPVSATSSAPSSTRSRASQVSGGADPFDGSLFTLLLVDDVAMNCTLLKRLLVRHKFHVDVAFDGQQAVDRVANNPFTFHNMPVLGGMAATSALRRLGFTFPIIGVTGDVMPEERLQFLRAGANEVVPKPVDFAKLLAIIKQMLPSMEERRAQIEAIQQQQQEEARNDQAEDAAAAAAAAPPRPHSPNSATSNQSARSHQGGSTDSSGQGSASSAPEPSNPPPPQQQQQPQP